MLLSATIGVLNGFDGWLNVNALVSDTRPVPLEFGVLDRSSEFEFIDADGNRTTEQLLPLGSVMQRGQNPSSQDVIVPLVQHLTASGEKREKVLIFRNQRGPAQGCARYISRDVGLPAADDVAGQVPVLDQSTTTTALLDALGGGAALHTLNLTRNERVVVERAFRDPDSRLRVLVATTMVAAGVNTPASTVIIVEHDSPWEGRDMTIAEIRNMAGRAGRLGYRETGRAILLAGNVYKRQRLFDKYVLAEADPITASFTEDDIGYLARSPTRTGHTAARGVVGRPHRFYQI